MIVYADGAVQRKSAGAGAVILRSDGQIAHIAAKVLPPMTNNEAEYAALLLALTHVAPFAPPSVEIRLDSEVVVNQMVGRFAVNSSRLKPWHRKACEAVRGLPQVQYTCIPRKQNGLADALATDAAHGRLWQLCSG